MTDEGELIAGRYRLVSQVGTGAMGVVWQARDERLQRIVAVKQLLLPSDTSESAAEEANRRAMREGRIAARLHHPHAITVYDVAEHEGKPCLIMEYLQAESLSGILATRGALPPEDVARIGSQIASALASAHEAGIVHRDIKPGNVLLADDGTAKITDFGISRAVGDSTVTATGIVAGTPAYLAPEIAQGQDAGFPADVFSLGSTLYTAAEGTPPFGLDDNFLALLYRIANGAITPPQRSGPLTDVLNRILEPDLSRRPTMQQAQELLAAAAGSSAAAGPVDAGLRSEIKPPAPTPVPAPVLGHAPAAAESSDTGRRRLQLGIAAVAVVAILAIATGVVLLTAPDTDGSRAAAPPVSSPSTTQDTTPNEPTPQPPPPVIDTPGAVPSAAPTTPPPTTPPPTTAVPPDSPGEPQAAVSGYYALMPANLPEGWNRLTADYQTNHAGGFSGYQTFWNAIQGVDVSDVSATSPTTVTATINYFFRDGRIITERTSFGLVVENGQWKIASSAVSSSRTTSG